MKSALITIGSTREFIDPVRYISNESSGAQGTAIIKELVKNKIKTTCICGHISVKKIRSSYVRYIDITTAKEMLIHARKNSEEVDIAIFNAAVSDYRVKSIKKNKIKKNNYLNLELVKNPDILLSISKMKKRPKLIVGFAFETNRHKFYAKKKLIDKNCDFLILNYPKKNTKIFGDKKNNGYLIDRNLNWFNLGTMNKNNFAKKIIKLIILNNNKL